MKNYRLESLISLGEELKGHYSADLCVQQKPDHSPVTEADLFSHRELLKILKPTGYPVLSEESAENFDRSEAETFWVIDPLDGTKDFIQKTGEFSIMVGLVQNGEPIEGYLVVPAAEKSYYAKKGSGAFLIDGGREPVRLQVDQDNKFHGCRFITSRNHFCSHMQSLSDRYELELIKCGSNGVKIGLMAEGRADIFFNPTNKMGLWDVCAPQIILEEAGGRVTDCRGAVINYQEGGVKLPFGIAASNGMLHEELIHFTQSI